MKAETAYYRIGGLVLRVDSALPFDLETDDMRDFRIGEAPADYVYRFQPCSNLPEVTGETRVVNEYPFGYDLLGKDGGHFRALGWKGRLYDVVVSLGADTGVISYLSEELMAERREAGFLFPNYLALEHLFYRFGGLFLHSSHVNMGGRALLFCQRWIFQAQCCRKSQFIFVPHGTGTLVFFILCGCVICLGFCILPQQQFFFVCFLTN